VLTTIGDTTGKVTKGQGDVTKGTIYVRLIDLNQRRKGPDGKRFSQFEVMGRARHLMLTRYPDLRVSVQLPSKIASGVANSDVEFTLVGPNLDRLTRYADQIMAILRANPGLVDVDTTMALRKPELRVNVDRERASDLGISIQNIASTLRILVGGQIVSDFKDIQLGELYDVWLRAEGVHRGDRRAITNLTLPSSKGSLVRLENVADLRESRGPSQIDRFNRQRKITLVANMNGLATSQAMDAFLAAGDSLNMPPEYQFIASGRAKTQNESNQAFLMAFSLSLLFMYMILAAQFESFVHPITILLAVPLTIPFALLSLMLLGQPLALYSILGIFLLFGIVKKNGILQVDYTNVLRERARKDPNEVAEFYRLGEGGSPGATSGSSWERWARGQSEVRRVRLWAILEANRTRLRPILMTTMMLVACMIPIALGEGPGAASRASMARVIVGGQAMSLLLSLLVTPVAYSLFDDLGLWYRRRRGSQQTSRLEPSGSPAV
jgi:HAE1 family hydrophobic/amphiphilic exporter-1